MTPPSGVAPAIWAELERAYDTPGRVYHGIGHVLDVLRWVDVVAADVGWSRSREVRLAALFHDAVYEPGAHDNEAESALLARDAIARHLRGDFVDADRVAELVLLTARHGRLTPGDVDPEAALFLDCDMAILGAAPDAFDAYDRGVAAEYAAVPPDLYAAGRRKFLAGLLARPRIFLSDYFHTRLDAPARKNLARGIS